MKKSILVIFGIFTLLALPTGLLFNSDGNIPLGMVILDVAEDTAEEVIDVGKPLAPKEPKKVEAVEEKSEEKTKSKEDNSDEKELILVEKKVTKEEPTEEKVEESKKSSSGESSSSSKKKKSLPSCSDYVDNNINYFKKGTCKDDRGKFMNKKYPEDYCDGDNKMVMEFACSEKNSCEGSWYVCPNGCENGACILEEKQEELQPDINLVSLDSKNNKIVTNVKNIGTKSSDFKLKITSGNESYISDVDYNVKPGELIEVELDSSNINIDSEYSVEVLSEDDQNLDNNVKNSVLKKENVVEITGNVVVEKKEKENIFQKITNFLREVFFN